MKTLVLYTLMFASTVTMHLALAADAPDRPPGVETKNWIAVSDNLGFVVVPPAGPPIVVSQQALLLTLPAAGYFMAKTKDGWVRLVIVEPVKGPGVSG